MKNICFLLTLCIFLCLITVKSTQNPRTVGRLNSSLRSIKLDSPIAEKFDEYEYITPKSEKPRLRTFAKEFKKKINKYSAINIIVYGKCKEEGEFHAKRIKDYLVNNHHINKYRIDVEAVCRKTFKVELWIRPAGAVSPIVQENETTNCTACDVRF